MPASFRCSATLVQSAAVLCLLAYDDVLDGLVVQLVRVLFLLIELSLAPASTFARSRNRSFARAVYAPRFIADGLIDRFQIAANLIQLGIGWSEFRRKFPQLPLKRCLLQAQILDEGKRIGNSRRRAMQLGFPASPGDQLRISRFAVS